MSLPRTFMEYPLSTASVETLPNGLTVILDPDATAPVVSAQIWIETGSIHEDRQLGAGLSHFLEHMVFKGTRDYDGEALADAVQAAGGHWNAYTTFERTVYYIDGPASSLPEFLKCLTGLVFFPTLPETEFEKEKDVIRREIDMGLDDPDQVATRLMLSTAFQHDPRRHPVIGHRHRFDAIRYEDLTTYHRERYVSDRCAVVVSGDFDPEATLQTIRELSTDCRPGCGREPFVASDPPQIGPRFARDRFAIPASRVAMTWHSPSLQDPEAPAFEVLACILGRGRSSRLYRQLREENALALEISAFSWSFSGQGGLFGISAEVEPAQREALIDAIKQELQQIDTDQLVSEIAKAKRQIAASQFRGLSTASGRASDLASNWHEARDLNFTRRYLQAIEAVSPDAVIAVAAHLNDERLCLTLLDPLDAPAPARQAKSKRSKEEIHVEILPNGVPLALIPDHRVPLIHLQAAVRAGMPSESPLTQGINQLLASSLPKGTGRRSAAQLALDLESLGASMSASAGNNALLVQAAGLAPDLATIGEIFAEVLIQPRLDPEAIERERASQRAALDESLQDPLHLAMKTLREHSYRSVGYGLHALGSPESLALLGREALVEHQRRHLNAANLSLAIAGDFEVAEVRDRIGSAMAALPAGEPWTPPASGFGRGREATCHLPKKQAVIAIGYEGLGVSSEERHALAFLQEYASDMAGPLFGRIREELGLAYQVGATQFLGYDSGLFTFYVATSPEQADLALQELQVEIGKIAGHGIPGDCMERVRATALSGLALQQQSLSSCARHCALDLLFGHPADTHRQLVDIYQRLRAEEVAAVAQRIFSSAPNLVRVLPEDGIE